MENKPTHEQAQLHLQVFDQRREAKLRQAREWFFKNYQVQTVEDAMRIAAPGTENGALANMVLSYWEQACALLNYGLLHDELFFSTSGEFFGVWEMTKAVVPQMRKQWVYKSFLANMEKAAQRYETWIEANSPGHIEAMPRIHETNAQPANTESSVIFLEDAPFKLGLSGDFTLPQPCTSANKARLSAKLPLRSNASLPHTSLCWRRSLLHRLRLVPCLAAWQFT